jgi:uncharacterized protein
MAPYHMHRQDREITDAAEIAAVLGKGQVATLAMARDNQPYIVTLNYGYDPAEGTLYFHCANTGLKLDFLRANPRVCGTVVTDGAYKVGECTYAYASVVFWGSIDIVHDEDEKRQALGCMIDFLEPDPEPVRQRLLAEGGRLSGVTVLKLAIEGITGKRAL